MLVKRELTHRVSNYEEITVAEDTLYPSFHLTKLSSSNFALPSL
ncbi:hypothetical protein THZG08_240010 [Vibrio owensii]|nr:hypothetical protein THZG08_240010 [Vibrio owensii]CAH1562114.1 hypothetical protein THOA03_240010 [Vibrio owensii]